MSNIEAGFATMAFITRPAARDLILEAGVPIGRNALADWASEGRGPPYYLVNNRALLQWATGVVGTKL